MNKNILATMLMDFNSFMAIRSKLTRRCTGTKEVENKRFFTSSIIHTSLPLESNYFAIGQNGVEKF